MVNNNIDGSYNDNNNDSGNINIEYLRISNNKHYNGDVFIYIYIYRYMLKQLCFGFMTDFCVFRSQIRYSFYVCFGCLVFN